jgi:hypothetical protein
VEAFLDFDELHQVLLIRFAGRVTDEVLLSHFQRVRGWLTAHEPCSNITDFSDVTSFEVTAQAVSQLAAGAPLVSNDFLRVVIAPQDEVFGMVRMFEMLGSSTRDQVHIVRTISEAYEITGIDSPGFRPVSNL